MTSNLMYPIRFEKHDLKRIGATTIENMAFNAISFPYGTSNEFWMPIILHFSIDRSETNFCLQSPIIIEASANPGTECIYKSMGDFGTGFLECTCKVSCETPGELVVAIQEASVTGTNSIESVSMIVPSFIA